jgi:hypothetical protein
MLIFLGGLVLDGGGAALDKVAQIGPVFTFLQLVSLTPQLFAFPLLCGKPRCWEEGMEHNPAQLLKNMV